MSDLTGNLVTEEEKENDAGEDAGADARSGGLKWYEILLIILGVVAAIFMVGMLSAG